MGINGYKCPLILSYQLGTHNIKNGFYIIFMPFWPLPPQLFTIDFWQWKAKNDNYMVCQKYLLLLLLNWLYCSIIIEKVDPWVHSGMMCSTQKFLFSHVPPLPKWQKKPVIYLVDYQPLITSQYSHWAHLDIKNWDNFKNDKCYIFRIIPKIHNVLTWNLKNIDRVRSCNVQKFYSCNIPTVFNSI